LQGGATRTSSQNCPTRPDITRFCVSQQYLVVLTTLLVVQVLAAKNLAELMFYKA
jgi:hypothetical protein